LPIEDLRRGFIFGICIKTAKKKAAEYYRLINKQMREQLGGLNSAKILLYSVNHQEINELESRDAWPELLEMMISGWSSWHAQNCQC